MSRSGRAALIHRRRAYSIMNMGAILPPMTLPYGDPDQNLMAPDSNSLQHHQIVKFIWVPIIESTTLTNRIGVGRCIVVAVRAGSRR